MESDFPIRRGSERLNWKRTNSYIHTERLMILERDGDRFVKELD